ncbi:TIGR03089 family protein [Arthrobacter sp. MDT2-2]
MPQTPAEILVKLRSVHPSSPRLVWHGRDGRIELSGRVFDNWVAKSSNLLADELDATGGTVVEFDLPVHWKSVALAFACWQVGAITVLPDVLPGSASPVSPASPEHRQGADIVLSSREGADVAPPRLLVCVALGSLALRWDGPLPRGAVDFAADVRSHGDVYLGEPAQAGDAPLVHTAGRPLAAGDLAGLVTLPSDGGPGNSGDAPTVLLEPGTDLLRALAAALAVWQQDGTLVLVEEGVPVTDRLLAGERVTGRLGTA